MTTNPLTIVGVILTLASLVGSFFYIHLSQSLRDLLALRRKTELNKLASDEYQTKAIVECQVEYTKHAACHTYIVNFAVIAFVVFVLADGLAMIQNAKTDPLYEYIWWALVLFLALFLVLSLGLTLLGHQNVREIRNMLSQTGP